MANTRAALFVDARATEVQRRALIAMAKTLAGRVVSTIAEVTPASIEFVADDHDIQVAVPTARLRVRKDMEHDSTCGNKKWFDPLSNVHHADLGIAVENAFSGASLGTKWSDPNKRSAFFGDIYQVPYRSRSPPLEAVPGGCCLSQMQQEKARRGERRRPANS